MYKPVPVRAECAERLRDSPRFARLARSERPVAIVYPVTHPVGLGIVRALADADIPVVALDSKPGSAGLYTVRALPVLLPSLVSEGHLDLAVLQAIGAQFEARPVLFLMDDEDVADAVRNGDRMRERFHLPISGWDCLERVIDKGKLYRFMQENGLPCPRTWFIDDEEALLRHRPDFQYPVIVKPTYSDGFRQVFRVKAKRCEDFETLRACVTDAFSHRLKIVVQEFVEGRADSLYTVTLYATRDGGIPVSFVGRKLRQYPADFGTCRLGESVDDPALQALAMRIVRALGYHGVASAEYKKGPDGSYKLIEINTRPGSWPEWLGHRCGVNIAEAVYRDCCGLSVPEHHVLVDGIKWLHLIEDAYYALRGYAKFGFPEEVIGLRDWLSSLRGVRAFAFFTVRDPLPALSRFAGTITALVRAERALDGESRTR